ncbi:MAG: DNA cytosine methyltransferase [Chloroflexi bacterium]|nr:DNA cytosine methyltransferase [Chloroflexota bacterium]
MKRSRNKLFVVDLFSGCGGLTQGLKDCAFRVIGAVEIDVYVLRTFETITSFY